MLFSATLDGAVKRLVDRYMHDPVLHEVESDEPTVEEMEHRFFLVHQMDKVKVVGVDRQRRRPHARVLRTKRGADRLVDAARPRGREGRAPSTATSRQGAREQALADFMAGKVPRPRRHRRRRPRHPRRRASTS